MPSECVIRGRVIATKVLGIDVQMPPRVFQLCEVTPQEMLRFDMLSRKATPSERFFLVSPPSPFKLSLQGETDIAALATGHIDQSLPHALSSLPNRAAQGKRG